jgi:hypothetical protein
LLYQANFAVPLFVVIYDLSTRDKSALKYDVTVGSFEWTTGLLKTRRQFQKQTLRDFRHLNWWQIALKKSLAALVVNVHAQQAGE